MRSSIWCRVALHQAILGGLHIARSSLIQVFRLYYFQFVRLTIQIHHHMSMHA